jgi:hypothetical protein
MNQEQYENCLDCPYHRVINDPDPDDWFCDDDQAIVCIKMQNPKQKPSSRHASDRSVHRVVMCAIRPYNLRKEGDAPSWCPLKT